MAVSFTNCHFFEPCAEPILALPAAETAATRLSPLPCHGNPQFIMLPGDLKPEATSVLDVAVLLKASPVEENRSVLFASGWRRMKEMLEAIVAEMLQQKVRLEDALEEFEKRFIQAALARSSGNQCKAAELLHVHRNTLARKIVQYKIRLNR